MPILLINCNERRILDVMQTRDDIDPHAHEDNPAEQLALFQLSEPVQLHLFDTTASHATH